MNAIDTSQDDIACLPNISRAHFCQHILLLCRRFEISYDPAEDELYHCCEAIAIALFMEGEGSLHMHTPLRVFLQARGLVRFRGE